MKVNSEAFAPLSETDDTWSGPVPELITVSVCVVPDVPWVIAGNDGSAGVRLTSGTAATPRAVQRKSLRTSRSIVRDLERRRECASARRQEVDADGTICVGSEHRPASIGFRKTRGVRPADGNGIDGEILTAAVNNGKHLGGAAGANRGAKICGGWKNLCGRAAHGLDGITRNGEAH